MVFYRCRCFRRTDYIDFGQVVVSPQTPDLVAVGVCLYVATRSTPDFGSSAKSGLDLIFKPNFVRV